jgi:hypothetical protein
MVPHMAAGIGHAFNLGNLDVLTFDGNGNGRMGSRLQETQRALDDDLLTDGDFNTSRQNNGILTNTRH